MDENSVNPQTIEADFSEGRLFSEQGARAMAEMAGEGIWAMNAEYRTTFVNRRMTEILGYSSQEMIGRAVTDFMYPEDLDDHRRRMTERRDGRGGRYEQRFRRHDDRPCWLQVSAAALMDEAGRFAGSLAMLTDITERKTMERDRREQSEFLATLVETIPNPVFYIDTAGRFFGCNRACEIFFDKPRQEIIGRTLAELHPGADGITCTFPPETPSFSTELVIPDPHGDWRSIILNQACLYDALGEVIGAVGVLSDITDLRRERDFSAAVSDILGSLLVVMDYNGRIVRFNRACQSVTGYTAEEVLDRQVWDIFLVDEEKGVVREVFASLQKGFFPNRFENYWLTKSGGRRLIAWNNTCLTGRDGRVEFIIASGEDITDRRHAEERVRSALKEKEVLLREIHHRVKNNLQTIKSLIYLQFSRYRDENLNAIYKDIQNRIHSMSLVHQNLYRSSDLVSINMREYLNKLLVDLIYSYGLDLNRIKATVSLENVSLDLDVSIPLGLIVTELVSNSLKYAFPEFDSANEIFLRLERITPGRFRLVVGDNGVGLPQSVDFRQSTTLGFQLVHSLVGQIGGEIELDRGAGSKFVISFNENRSPVE